MSPPSSAPRCAEHAQRAAGWCCDDCQRALCPDCVASEAVGAPLTTFESCVWCDGRAVMIHVPGARESYLALLVQSLRLPVGWPTVVSALTVWTLVEMAFRFTQGVSALSFAALVCVLWALFFAVLQAAARGADLVGEGGAVALGHEVLLPAARLAAISIGIAGLLLWADFRAGAVHGVYADPRAWLVTVPLALTAPAVIIPLARGAPLLSALSPFSLASVVRALRFDYAVLAAVTTAIGALVLFWIGAGNTGARAGIQLLPLLLHVLSLFALLSGARFIGIVMAARATALGLPLRPDQRILALPGVAPRGVRRRKEPAAPPPPRPSFVELDTEVPSGPMQLEGFADVDPLDQELATFVAESDEQARARPTPDLVAIGQRAAARARLDEAVRALKLAAAARPEDPDAPRACVILARLYAERLAEPAAAEKLYRFVLQRYPQSAAARFATEQLASFDGA